MYYVYLSKIRTMKTVEIISRIEIRENDTRGE
jgi:hypothetical protein